ncbi:PEP-CTERM sorting domain-containing protein [Okeania sp.]|uniref:PEP-CTERM sorting domain-containing protein n=1 Tax=Okeania sp. TaxID=3100323 RepID=UPI002B4B2B50|nr:PEP-CTERM sorting domain-containing protein [Okeania sp.]MEB3341144.1 PEP-CTERM sorting domain-containing protein [Okeania sp.]
MSPLPPFSTLSIFYQSCSLIMNMKFLTFTTSAIFSAIGLTLTAFPAQAAIIHYEFSVLIESGSLVGQTFDGTFRYDDADVAGSPQATATVTGFDFDFNGANYCYGNLCNGSIGETIMTAPVAYFAVFDPSAFVGLNGSYINGDFSFDFNNAFVSPDDSSFDYSLSALPNDSGVGKPSYSAVPEPFTLLGAVSALFWGATFKRKVGHKGSGQKLS